MSVNTATDLNWLIEKLPQKSPFLFVDKIIEKNQKTILTEKTFSRKEEFFKGHFPGDPIVPGVILQEALFQSACLLMIDDKTTDNFIGLVTRVGSGKFKQLIRPEEKLDLKVEHTESAGDAFYFKGRIYKSQKLAVSLEFTCFKKERE